MRTIELRLSGSDDADDVARFVAEETRALLSIPGVVEVVPGQAQLSLEAMLTLEGEELAVAATLSEGGSERAAWTESLPLGQGFLLGQLLARATLLELGEDAAAPAEVSAEPVAAGAFLAACRGLRLLESDAEAGCEELLEAVRLAPELEAPRRLLLAAAREAEGGALMPTLLSALEELHALLPGDVEVLLALGDYRALHLDRAGARELFFTARDLAPDAQISAHVLARLAALALQDGQEAEAIAHLRAAIKLADEPMHYHHLGLLLQEREPGEALRMHARAAVLAPDDARIRLDLARALRTLGDDPGRAEAEALEAARLAQGDPALEAEVGALFGQAGP